MNTSPLRTDKRTLAVQLRDRIRDLLRTQQLGPGEKIPSEGRLGQIFGVSRVTVREALKYLEEERVIICRHGSGRFVATAPGMILDEEITRLQSVTEMAQSLGINISSRVLDLRKVIPDDETRDRLQLGADEAVYIFERARLSEEQPVIYSVDIFPARLLPDPPDPGKLTGSLLDILEQGDLRLEYAKSVIRAVLLEPAIASSLKVDPTIPWILLEQVNYDRFDHPILYSRDYHNAEIFQFRVLRRRR